MFKGISNTVFWLSVVFSIAALCLTHHLAIIKAVNRERFPSMRIPERPLQIASWTCLALLSLGSFSCFLSTEGP